MTAYKTTCCYCGVGCGMLVEKDRKGRINATGNPLHPVNKGMLCSKGMNLHYTAMDHRDRLLFPMSREKSEGPFNRITWKEAIQKAAEKFREIIKEHGPDAVGFYISGQCLTEEYYLANKIVKGFIGTNNIDTNSRLCMSSAVSAYKLALGEDSVPGCYEDIELADTFLIAGANPAWCHPILYRRIEAHKAKNSNVKMIVVDPRRTQTAAEADLHLQIFPGTDIVLYHAIARGLIENGFIDENFIQEHTEGFETLKQKVMQRSLQEAATVCGIKFTDLYKAIKYIGYSGGFISMWAMGHNQSVIGVNKNLALINLSLITGKIGKPGSGPFSLTGQANAMGGREVGGMATLLSAHRDMDNPLHRKEIAEHWKVDQIPDKPGLTATEMFTALRNRKMKAIWIIATNPLVSLPDVRLAETALQKADFVVVQDMSAKADTIPFAHLVLPAATWLEKEGTMTNSERRISHLAKVLDPPGEALPDTEILLRFAKAMGWKKFFNYKNSDEIFQEHAALTKGTHLNISGLNYEKLNQTGTIQWPVTDNHVYGTQRLFTDHRFYHSNEKAKIHAAGDKNLSEAVSEDHPLILTTGRIRDQWHTMTRTGKVNKLKQHISHPFLEIHPEDAAKRKISDGNPVIVSNDRGKVQVIAQLSKDIKKGVVFLPMHWGKLANKDFARANNLTSSLTDPVSKQPGFKFSAVEVNRYDKPKEKIIIIGESPCIPIFFQEYRKLNANDTIDWICNDPDQAFYDRDKMLSHLKGAVSTVQDSTLETIAENLNINITKSRSVVAISPQDKSITDNKGKNYAYDRLVFAGVKDQVLPDPSTDNIFHWSNKQKVRSFMEDVSPDDEVILTGKDPILCEAAATLAEKGMIVHIITEGKRLCENILDVTGSVIMEDALTGLGIQIHYEEKSNSPVENKTIFLKSGQRISFSAIIDFSFEQPDTTLVAHTNLKTNSGIAVDDFLQTNYPGLFIIGVSAASNDAFPYQPAAGNKQAACLAQYFNGNFSVPYTGVVPSFSWQVSDLKITVTGNILSSDEDHEEIVFTDRQQRQYKKCVIQNDRLTGFIFMGNQDGIERYHKLIKEGTELGELRNQLLQPGNTGTAVDGKIVCSCRQVGENHIIAAIKNGSGNISELGSATGAGTQCGSCKPELKALLSKYRG